MTTTEQITFNWHGLDVVASVCIERDDDVTPGSVDVDEIESVSCEGQEMPDDFVSHFFGEIALAAQEAVRV